MASNPPGKCCVEGVKHEGQTFGTKVDVSGNEGYLATPDPAKAKAGKAILYVPDVHGIWTNSQLMADQYAANGYLTLIIDLFHGDVVSKKPESMGLMDWVTNGSDGKTPHTPAGVDPIVEAALKWLKAEKGVTQIGAAGYCFGAKYVARHFKNGINVGYFAHPSFVDEAELRGFRGPLSISAAQTDEIFPAEMRHQSEKILAEKGDPWQINLYSGTSHGFSVRGDPNNKLERFAKEQAFIQAVTWFDSHL